MHLVGRSGSIKYLVFVCCEEELLVVVMIR